MLDTSSLVSAPSVYKDIDPGSLVIIPIIVLGELDKLKKFPGGPGRNARVAIRNIDAVSELGDISTGVLLDNGTVVKVDAKHFDLSHPAYSGFGDPTYGDTQILACVYTIWNSSPEGCEVILVSNDINLRIKAKSRGIEAIGFEGGSKVNELYSGCSEIVDEDKGFELKDSGSISADGLDANLHEFITFKTENGNIVSSGRKVSDNKIKLVKSNKLWEITPRNDEQKFAADLIMDRGIDLVTMVGPAGCGKSLVALAAALELVLSRREFNKLVIYRPIQPMGSDIGFIPGSVEEKLAPWFEAIMDSFEILFGAKNDWRRELEMFKKKGRIEMNALTYIRGRSIPNAIILCDEFQNLTKEEAKTILTRVGEGTKIILTGDINQIDKEDLDAGNNGLTYVIEKFKDSPLAGHITLTKGERSRLATLAADIL